MEEPASFGERLRRLRGAAGLTQEQLAEQAGLSVQGIASLESGRSRRPFPHTLRALGDALALSPAEYAALLATIPGRNKSHRESAPAQTVSSPFADGRVPLFLTGLIGRNGDLDALEKMLREGARILTLTGPGGVGKTSLALRLAESLADRFPDGVTFVPLAPVADPALVIPSIVHVLHLPETGATAARDSLNAYLRDKQILLILDNFEQVLNAAPDVADLMGSSAGLSVLVTSRAPLRVRGEREYAVQPLQVPELICVPEVADIAGNPAVSLFVDRAQAADPAFQLGRENVTAIAAICRRLDGLPLAIELAAARIRVLSPIDLLSRLDSALPVLSGGARDLPERQRTMRRAIEWSYDLLDAPQKSLFTSLSVFRGGWTLEAAEAVAGGKDKPDVDVLDNMSLLVEQSLVVAQRTDDGSTRFRFLVPIREFAAEHLERWGDARQVRKRHAEYLLQLSAQAEVGLTGPQQVKWLSRLELERDNIRAAFTWLLSAQEWDVATRLGWNLWVFLWIRGYQAEGRSWMSPVLEQGSRVPPVARARALGLSGALALGQGDIPVADSCSAGSYSLFASEGDELSAARIHLVLGLIASASGDAGRAVSHLREAAEVFRGSDHHFWAGLAVSAHGMLPFRDGDYDRAEVLLAEGHDLARRAGDRFSRYIALYNHARLSQSRGNTVEAAGLFREGLVFSLEVGDRANIAYCLEGLAAVVVARGDADRAARLLGGADALFEAVGARVYTYRPDTSQREQTAAAAQAQLDEDGWAVAWDAGRTMPMDDVVAMALTITLSGGGDHMSPAQPEPGPSSPESRLISIYGLTAREIEVLGFLITHHSYREIADALYISPRTVGTHITSIHSKLGVTSRREAAKIAAEIGLNLS